MRPDPIATILRQPEIALSLDERGWDVVIRFGRAANVLARIAEDLKSLRILDKIPAAPRAHLHASLALATRQRLAGLAEVEHVRKTLAAQNLRCVLLKGAAYLAADMPLSRGRLFGDIDLLFPRNRMLDAESALLLGGWSAGDVSPYDQRYYRTWMHELPPFTHIRRKSILDIHHNILPLTSHRPPDAQQLLDAAVELAKLPGVWVLSPADMVLHSACHLFHEGELHNGLRDLSDLDRLLRYFCAQPNFWRSLIERAHLLHLEHPLQYALRYTQAILQTPVPADIAETLSQRRTRGMTMGWKMPQLQQAVMDALYLRGLRPAHPLAGDRWTPFARWLLYVRAHWLRMPPYLLASHLARKAWYRFTGLDEKPAASAERQ